MIQVKHLIKRYGQRVVLNGIDLTVKKGEILGFLGTNGAGKSTTMNIITGYLSPTDGTVIIDGMDILKKPKEVKRKIGYLPETPPLYSDMTVEEYLKFVYKLKNIGKIPFGETIDSITERVKISSVRKRLIKNLSKGYKQRIGLAQAIIGDPEVIILDEPTVGLDPKEIIEIRKLINDIGENHTVILSSHVLSEVSSVCGRIAIINNGQIAATGTPDELAKLLSRNSAVLLRVRGNGKDLCRLLHEIKDIRRADIKGVVEKGTVDILVEAKQDLDVREILFWKLSKAEIPVLMLKPMGLSLEEIFLQVTSE